MLTATITIHNTTVRQAKKLTETHYGHVTWIHREGKIFAFPDGGEVVVIEESEELPF